MSTPFKVGDIVQLVSGGPKMTVEQVGLKVHVVWFVFQGEPSMTWSTPYRDQFEAELLKPHVPFKGKKQKDPAVSADAPWWSAMWLAFVTTDTSAAKLGKLFGVSQSVFERRVDRYTAVLASRMFCGDSAFERRLLNVGAIPRWPQRHAARDIPYMPLPPMEELTQDQQREQVQASLDRQRAAQRADLRRREEAREEKARQKAADQQAEEDQQTLVRTSLEKRGLAGRDFGSPKVRPLLMDAPIPEK